MTQLFKYLPLLLPLLTGLLLMGLYGWAVTRSAAVWRVSVENNIAYQEEPHFFQFLGK